MRGVQELAAAIAAEERRLDDARARIGVGARDVREGFRHTAGSPAALVAAGALGLIIGVLSKRPAVARISSTPRAGIAAAIAGTAWTLVRTRLANHLVQAWQARRSDQRTTASRQTARQ